VKALAAVTQESVGKSQMARAALRTLHPPEPTAASMQRVMSNQATQHLLRTGSIQTKLTVNTPGDEFEREADQVADQVMRMSMGSMSESPPSIQRMCTSCSNEIDERPIQRMCKECDDELQRKEASNPSVKISTGPGSPGAQRLCDDCEEEMQRQESDHSEPELTNAVESQILTLQSGGEPLPAQARSFFEPRFGRDFSDVRVHVDASAAVTAQSVNALAYTRGNHIVFGAGHYQPNTSTGRRLLAHELTHVVQQRQGGSATVQRSCGAAVPAGSCTSAASVFTPGVGPFRFRTGCDDFRSGQEATMLAAVAALPPTATMEIHGYASVDTPALTAFNERLACARANKAQAILSASPPTGPGVGARITNVVGHGPTPGPAADRQSVVLIVTVPPPPLPPPPPPPVCGTAVPTTTPATCAGRNAAYCAAAGCIPTNPWLSCVCTASGEVCRAVNAFTFVGTEGAALDLCISATATAVSRALTSAKGAWLLSTNRCIWGHWRAAFEAIHNPAAPIPSGLTAEWAAAVTTCRTRGVGSKACCDAHVEAEQHAIDTCGPYPSTTFGPLPTDVPGAPMCGRIVAALAPPPAFTGDFGLVADRITYGKSRCCP
jgi:hypothetical protein